MDSGPPHNLDPGRWPPNNSDLATALFKIFYGATDYFRPSLIGSLIKCYMDETVDPCEQFYDYACGNWNAFHPIPRDRGGYDTFEILREDLDTKLISMLKESVSETDNNATTAAKVLYSSCMNTSTYCQAFF